EDTWQSVRQTQLLAHYVQGYEHHLEGHEVARKEHVEQDLGSLRLVLRKNVTCKGSTRQRQRNGANTNNEGVEKSLTNLDCIPRIYEVLKPEHFRETPGVIGILKLRFEDEHERQK